MYKIVLVLLIVATAGANSACASKRFVRTEVGTSADRLDSRIDANEGEIAEVRDGLTRVDERVGSLDTQTAEHNERLDGLTGNVENLTGNIENLDEKTATVETAANRLNAEMTTLDQNFQNRNNYMIAEEKSVFFGFDSSTLESEHLPVLDEVAEFLNQNRDAMLVLEGRTDATGNDEYNIRLGERRSEAVKRYLVVDKGVPIFKLHQISFGAAQPVADNTTREGRQANRAVNLLLLVPQSDASTASR